MQLTYYATTAVHHVLDISDLPNHSWVGTTTSYQIDKEKEESCNGNSLEVKEQWPEKHEWESQKFPKKSKHSIIK